jgi:hypothetical protein
MGWRELIEGALGKGLPRRIKGAPRMGAAPCALPGSGLSRIRIEWPVTASKKGLPYVLEPSPLSVNRTMRGCWNFRTGGETESRYVCPASA